MSNLDGNPHYEISERMMAVADDFPEPEHEAQVGTLAALQQATLAIAYEQRTANLIAKLALNTQAFIASKTRMASTSEAWDAVDDEIITRLGLNKGTPE